MMSSGTRANKRGKVQPTAAQAAAPVVAPVAPIGVLNPTHHPLLCLTCVVCYTILLLVS